MPTSLPSLLVKVRAHNLAHCDETSQILRGLAEEHLGTKHMTEARTSSVQLYKTLAMIGGTGSCDSGTVTGLIMLALFVVLQHSYHR